MPETRLIKTVIDWDHFLLYLCGPIDFSPDGGKSYRDEWAEKLSALGINPSRIINPCRKPLAGAQFDLDDEAAIIREHRKSGKWLELTEIMSQIVHMDLRFVDLSSLVLAYFPQQGMGSISPVIDSFMNAYTLLAEKNKNYINDHSAQCCLSDMLNAFNKLIRLIDTSQTHTYGTIHEIVVARQQRKPVMIVWEGGKPTCSAWMMWLVGEHNVFSTFDELLEHLSEIASGEAAYNARDWLLLDLK